jgi:hypothetical protein
MGDDDCGGRFEGTRDGRDIVTRKYLKVTVDNVSWDLQEWRSRWVLTTDVAEWDASDWRKDG